MVFWLDLVFLHFLCNFILVLEFKCLLTESERPEFVPGHAWVLLLFGFSSIVVNWLWMLYQHHIQWRRTVWDNKMTEEGNNVTSVQRLALSNPLAESTAMAGGAERAEESV